MANESETRLPQFVPATNSQSADAESVREAGAGGTSLRGVAISAAKLEMLAYVAGQFLRFGSSLVLSRLLFPEAFGLSVIVGLVGQGLVMISNVGAGQFIVQSAKGDDLTFLNTAWTLLAVRGIALWLLASVLAYPLSLVLRQPDLAVLIPVGTLNVVIGGFASTSVLSFRRHLRVRPLVIIEILSLFVTVAMGVVLAWIFRSVWALIASGLTGALFATVASHLLNIGYRNRFCWNREAWRAIYVYGRWIQASSTLSFVSSQADRFLMAHYMGIATLGVYNYALVLSEAISAAVARITHGVLFPILSQMHRDEPLRLSNTYYRVRLRMDLLTMLPLGIVAASSQLIVNLLFDSRYAAAGWMLQALCVRAAMTCMLTPAETYLFAIGQTKYSFYRDFARCIWILGGIPCGWYFQGLEGLIWVVALSEIPVWIVLWLPLNRLRVLQPIRELIGPLAFALGFSCVAAILAVLRATH